MSIPPLVCSTPPPPDQCEEDKDPDDFGIPYNLSQDDDDEEAYGYGDFSSFDHYQSNCITRKETGSTNLESVPNNKEEKSYQQVDSIDISQSQNAEQHYSNGSNPIIEDKPKHEEDINIEDLGLEVNEESVSSSEREDDHSEVDNSNEHSEKVLEHDVTYNNTPSSPSSEDNRESHLDHCKERVEEAPVDNTSLELEFESSESPSANVACEQDIITEENFDAIKETNIDDDFGDFDDFQFFSQERKTSDIFENCDNPWDTNTTDKNGGFSEFTATFDAIERRDSPVNLQKTNVDNKKSSSNNEDDDFGDFDDFKSSVVNEMVEAAEQPIMEDNIPMLNLHNVDSEHQVMESITKVLTSIFEEEISQPEQEFDGKLETMLCETWRHLRETDVRQPYIINWNNSLGQKTLLKALCIDSRNILFGPKWAYNMPKYAVNLSAAPLQPQKPVSSLPSQSEAVSVEKPTAKPSGWTDPFTADGQESCNADTGSVVEVTPTDLDVFEAAISKTNKIYSNTLNVQPLRQISLPDTHIFTPTDSETPTSKTVHYDSGPPILLPQTALDSGEQSESSTVTTLQQNDPVKSNAEDDDEYWEFQDFKSGSEKSTSTEAPVSSPSKPNVETKTENAASKPNVTYQTQVLQPIKMEPLIPTVNWPDPGEIKETFDDFSDFVSNSAWSDKPQDSIPQTENKATPETNVLDKINDKHKNVEEETRPKLNNEDFDDDFDTFQSALPPKHIVSDFNFDSLATGTFNNNPSQNSKQTSDFNCAFPKMNNVKSETISGNTRAEPFAPIQSLPTTELPSNKSLTTINPMPSLLQPMPSSTNFTSSQSKQKTGQILQPLSLESYSQINWPNPGIDLQDLSRFNPVETLQSLKSDLSVGGPSKVSSPAHSQKATNNQAADEDIWGEFVSSKPKQGPVPKKPASFVDDDEWTDFVSSPTVKPQNGLNTISLNVHTNSSIQKTNNRFPSKNNQPLDIPTLNYITPKTSGHNSYTDRHFQNL